MSIFRDAINISKEIMKDAAEGIKNPEKAGREDAKKNYRHASPSTLAEQIARLSIEEKKDYPGEKGRLNKKYCRGKKDELKKMFDNKLK